MEMTFSPTLLEAARNNIDVLFERYHAATGIPRSTAAQIIVSDRAFATRFRSRDFVVGTYDLFAGRMSLLWPKTHPWPEGIPRPAPIALTDAGARLMAEREATRVAPPPIENWPDDIPHPETF